MSKRIARLGYRCVIRIIIYQNRDLKDISVILVVDGMQQFMSSTDDGLKEDSDYYRTKSSIAGLAFGGSMEVLITSML